MEKYAQIIPILQRWLYVVISYTILFEQKKSIDFKKRIALERRSSCRLYPTNLELEITLQYKSVDAVLPLFKIDGFRSVNKGVFPRKRPRSLFVPEPIASQLLQYYQQYSNIQDPNMMDQQDQNVQDPNGIDQQDLNMQDPNQEPS